MHSVQMTTLEFSSNIFTRENKKEDVSPVDKHASEEKKAILIESGYYKPNTSLKPIMTYSYGERNV